MSVSIIPCTEPAELFRHYDGQSEAQGAYIELDTQDGTLLADWDGEIGGAVPFSVHHGLQRRYSIPILTADAANRIMQEILPLAERIVAGAQTDWDGNNTVVVLDEDAAAAEEEVEKLLGLPSQEVGYADRDIARFDESDLVAQWDIGGATNGSEVDEYEITGDTTDARLDEIEAEILSDLVDCGESDVAVCPGLDDYLRELRNDLANENPLTGPELRIQRMKLGLTDEHLAKLLGVNIRTLRAWESGRDEIPGTIRPEIAELVEATDRCVDGLVTLYQEEDNDDDAVVTYRDDAEYLAAHPDGRWTAAWHLQVCARVAEQTGARIDYADTTAE